MKTVDLSASQKQQVIEKTQAYIEEANSIFSLSLEILPVYFDLYGSSSGMFQVRNRDIRIRYNEVIFAHYFDDAIINTVGHEVAHYIIYKTYGLKRVKPHGKEWKSVMSAFGLKAEVTSHYNVSDLPLRRQQQFIYTCGCSQHQLSATRHNRVNRNQAVYKCRSCHQALKYASVCE